MIIIWVFFGLVAAAAAVVWRSKRGQPATNGRSFILAVVGESYRNEDGTSRQKIIAKCRHGDAINLIPEPENPHDHLAIAVKHQRGQLGYISRDDAPGLLADLLGQAISSCRIFKVIGGTADKPSLGVLIEITVKTGRTG